MKRVEILEFLKFLETAQKLGSTHIEIQAFRVVCDQEKGPEKQNQSRDVKPRCEDCGSNDLRESNWKGREGTFYCHDCHLDRKQKEWSSQKTW
jgi:late competence protein required for DNA uptake (superfamily II DNA/RNA helicase)